MSSLKDNIFIFDDNAIYASSTTIMVCPEDSHDFSQSIRSIGMITVKVLNTPNLDHPVVHEFKVFRTYHDGSI